MIDHVALEVADVEASKAFYDRALAPLEAGGSDNGEPGLREYHEHYYGALVLDPDGNNVETVCHLPE
jgi:catechol 2,3-dioxygenase-like lactoylglutathione lyase family enzyme